MIRPAQTMTAAKIAEIYNTYVANTWISFEMEPVSAAEILKRMSDSASRSLPWLVLEIEGEVIGYACATRWRERAAYRHAVETTVYLANSHTGRGFGRLIYAALISELAAAGFHSAVGGIALPNEASVRLHESLGFKKVAHLREVGWKFERWIDVGYWQLMLQDAAS